MPAVIEAVDLVALAAILLLIGLLSAVSYTFVKLANVLDVGILGYHPFAGIAGAIRSTIVAGCQAGIKDLGSAAHDLWAGSQWMLNKVVQALMAIPNGVHRALQYLWNQAIPDYVKASIGDLHSKINALDTEFTNDFQEVANDVIHLNTRLDNTVQAALEQAGRNLHDAITGVYHDIGVDLGGLRTTIETDIHNAVNDVSSTAAQALSKVEIAENAALSAVSAAETATAGELRDFIGEVPLGDIGAIIAAVPLLRALIQTLEAETGLENESCRAKVKGICGTDPSQWEKLLEGLVLLGVGFSLQDIFTYIGEAAGELVGIVEQIAGE